MRAYPAWWAALPHRPLASQAARLLRPHPCSQLPASSVAAGGIPTVVSGGRHFRTEVAPFDRHPAMPSVVLVESPSQTSRQTAWLRLPPLSSDAQRPTPFIVWMEDGALRSLSATSYSTSSSGEPHPVRIGDGVTAAALAAAQIDTFRKAIARLEVSPRPLSPKSIIQRASTHPIVVSLLLTGSLRNHDQPV